MGDTLTYASVYFLELRMHPHAKPQPDLPWGQIYLANDVREKKNIYTYIFVIPFHSMLFSPDFKFFFFFFFLVLLSFFIGFVLLWWKIFTWGCGLSSAWRFSYVIWAALRILKDQDESLKERLGFKSSKKYLRFQSGVVKHLMSVVMC